MFVKKYSKFIIFFCLAIIFIFVFALVFLRSFVFPTKGSNCGSNSKESTVSAKTLAVISTEKLKEFDGVKNSKTYIGLDCLVYDVTAGKEQYYNVGKPYHYLVGRDATEQLKIFGGDIIKKKYPVVGILRD